MFGEIIDVLQRFAKSIIEARDVEHGLRIPLMLQAEARQLVCDLLHLETPDALADWRNLSSASSARKTRQNCSSRQIHSPAGRLQKHL